MKEYHMTLKPKDQQYLEGLLLNGFLPVKKFSWATALLERDRGRALWWQLGGILLSECLNWRTACQKKLLYMLQGKASRLSKYCGKQNACSYKALL